MSAAPILQCSDWDGLLDAVTGQRGPAPLAGIDRTVGRAVLAAPAALALWIAHREPRLAAASVLRLLVIGAETVDAADQGRWYAWIPKLLDAGFEVETTLVGESLDPAFTSAAAHLAPARPARLLRTGLAEHFRARDPGAYDLAVVFHPGMQKNRGWLTDASLAQIVSGGTPLIASSYEPAEAEVEAWVLECHGYGVAGEALLNPFYLDLSHERTQVHWGRALWKFDRKVPAPGHAPDQHRLAALDLLSRMVMHSMLEGGGEAFAAPGAKLELQSSAGTRLELIHVFDRRFADPASGQIVTLTERGALEPTGTLGAQELAAYPARGSDLERAVWAAGIKARHFLRPDDPARATGYGSTRAAGMLATLRERARRLFDEGGKRAPSRNLSQ